MPSLIGTAPNQVPVNGMLGTAAFVDLQQIQRTLIATGSINGVNSLNITNIPTYKRLYVVVDDNTFTSSDQIRLALSVDNGATFPGISPTVSNNAATPTVTSVYCEITGTDVYKKRLLSWHGNVISLIETSSVINSSAINAIRLFSNNGNNFTGAIYYLYGEN